MHKNSYEMYSMRLVPNDLPNQLLLVVGNQRPLSHSFTDHGPTR